MIERTDDAHSLSLLHSACFADGWSAASIAGLLAQPGVVALSARGAGFVLVRVAADEAEIVTVCVLTGLRQQGLGSHLIQAAAAKAETLGAKTLFLEVAEDNASARALYMQLGFAEVGKRKAYYQAGTSWADALVMRVDLPLDVPERALGNPLQSV